MLAGIGAPGARVRLFQTVNTANAARIAVADIPNTRAGRARIGR
jgi:hypothetical protein